MVGLFDGKSPEEFEKIFLQGGCPELTDLVGKWEGVFLPFVAKLPISDKLLNLSNFFVRATWGKIWKGKEFFTKGEQMEGVNLIGPLKTLKFQVKKVKSRLDDNFSIELDYSKKNLPPISFIKDEIRFVNSEKKDEIIGIMFLEFPPTKLENRIPVIFFGLRKKS